ncbi:P-loop containing nucleoside triphosphate hydrolase protein [Russula emetica]|nr:P-loop containing nucleoside triphosphate hydrolase protein [Russula emetica]
MGYLRYALAFAAKPFAPNYLRTYRPNHVRFASKLKSTDKISPQLKTPLPFAGLGLPRAIRVGLKSAFPGVANATNAQSTFVPAITEGKDVMIKGHPGSGKSFGLVLALLSKCWHPLHNSKRSLPASLLLVPHRDLAYQFMHWIECITAATHNPHNSTLTQVIVRGQEEPSSQASRLRENPPSILIGTPQAILDVLREDEHAINLTGLDTVVVDEVDYIIDFIPADASKDKKKKLAAKIRRHPRAGKLLLDRIYSPRIQPDGPAGFGSCPQLVVCSATLQTGLRQQLLYHSGWFKKSVDSVVKVRSELPAGETRKPEKNVAAPDVILDEVVEHCALIFSEDGSVRDVGGAVEPKSSPESEDSTHGEEVQTWTDPQDSDLPKIRAQPTEEYDAGTPSAFHPVVMEGVAAIFATAVPKMALLVLPASAPVERAVHDLRALGINAFGLDLQSTDRRVAYLARGNLGGTEENPTLLVATTASLRGIDLPELSHVFVWGVVDVNSYLHASGRVGRFGRKGRVVSMLEDERRQSDRYVRLLKSIGLIPAKFYRL